MSSRDSGAAYSPWIGVVVEPDFEAMSWREADAFLKELVSRIPERAEQLEARVRATKDFGTWRANGSERSFLRLGPWLKKSLKHRWLSPAEKTFVVMNPKLPRRIAADMKRRWKAERVRELTPESESLLADVGMYMAACLHKEFPSAQWIRCKAKRNIWFNHPLLGTDTNDGFNPIMIPLNCADQMLHGDCGEDGFLAAYRVWRDIFLGTESWRRKHWAKGRTRRSRS